MRNTILLLLVLLPPGLYAQTYTATNYNVVDGNSNGIKFYNGNDYYSIRFGNSSNFKYGPVNDWSIKFSNYNLSARGWTWGPYGTKPVAALTVTGKFQIASDFYSLGNVRSDGHIYGRSANATYSHLYRFGGLFLTWDSDSYGTNTHHSIRSTYGDNYGDEITINSYNHLRVNLDANNNDPASYFEVGQHTTGTGNILMRLVSPSGNLGVGVTNPQEKLHVNGNIRGNQSGGALRIRSTHGWVDVGPRNGSWAHFATDRPRYYFDKGITVDQGLIGSYNEDLRLQTSGTTRITVSNTSGNVGVGTTTPAYKLDVNGPVNATEFRVNGNLLTIPPQYWNQTGTDIDYSAGNVGIGTATPAHALDVNGAINATEIRLNGEIFNPTVWNQSGTDINYTGGTVSIGTAVVPLDYKLAVDGNIVAEEVQVLLSDIWPDYVFEEDYELKPLKEVERFVKANKHLPDVPSAEEVAEEGQGLGKMNTILLRKVEELTLYLIEQQKTIRAHETRIEELYRRLEQKNN